nr:MAG TPA: hypothetical protein [Herelleviridae sp.]
MSSYNTLKYGNMIEEENMNRKHLPFGGCFFCTG